jgi:hypothetical protein
MFFRKIAIFVFKINTIKRNQFSEKLGFNLLNKIIQSISINKRTLFSRVSMKVKEENESFFFVEKYLKKKIILFFIKIFLIHL